MDLLHCFGPAMGDLIGRGTARTNLLANFALQGAAEEALVDKLLGDPGKARRVLGWTAATPVEQLCKEMVEADLKLVRAGDMES